MYRLGNIFDKNPIQISGAVMAVVNLPIIGQVWTPDPALVSGINTALVAVLGLFIVSKTTNSKALEEVDGAVVAAHEEGLAGGFDDAVALAGAIEEQVTGKVAETLEAVALLTVPPVVPPSPAPTKAKKVAKKRAPARG